MSYLYHGGNLRLHIKNESAALVYLDPPFKSIKDYDMTGSGAK